MHLPSSSTSNNPARRAVAQGLALALGVAACGSDAPGTGAGGAADTSTAGVGLSVQEALLVGLDAPQLISGYLIEDGKLGAPVKGATLIGAGSEALTRVGMVGNDMSLDPGLGTCGKDGQSVPVGCGQATLRITGVTVGGTAA